LGAQSVSAGFSEEDGHACSSRSAMCLWPKMNNADLSDIRARILDELRRIASWKSGAPELLVVQQAYWRSYRRDEKVTRQSGQFPTGFWIPWKW
jgi:hypothetical protein